jgi:hypothetical protein
MGEEDARQMAQLMVKRGPSVTRSENCLLDWNLYLRQIWEEGLKDQPAGVYEISVMHGVNCRCKCAPVHTAQREGGLS